MRVATALATALLLGALSTLASAQDKTEEECLDITEKHIRAMAANLREQKPSGRCALAKWSLQRHQEMLRAFSIEPEECRKSQLGKKLEDTLKSRIREETASSKRHCKRS
jgi:hypothetical protein